MNTITPELRDLARSILAESASPREPHSDATFAICDKLREPLVKLAGAEGFRQLLARGLSLAKLQDPLLSGLQVSPDGTLKRVETLPPQTSETSWAEAEVHLIAQVLSLLGTFIGHALTLHLVQGIWPNLNGANTP